jgi:hypothetical protein
MVRSSALIRLFILCIIVSTIMYADGSPQTVIEDLLNPNTQADYLIITPSRYISSMQQLGEFRQSKNGFSIAIVITDSIYSNFGQGIGRDSAIKNFITYTLTGGWDVPAPQYILLAGGFNDVPSHLEPGFNLFPGILEDSVCIDQWFVEVGPDSIIPPPAASIGRLPGNDSSSIATMVEKTISNESSPESPWMGRTLMAADYNNDVDDLFERSTQTLQTKLVHTWHDTATVHVRQSSALYKTREEFRALWSKGSAIVSLVGMANWMQFSRDAYFTTWDVDSLIDNTPCAFFTMDSDQRFERTDTLAIVTRLLEAQHKGAVATLAPTGLIVMYSVSWFFPSVFEYMSTHPNTPIGKIILDVKTIQAGGGGWYFIRRYTLLGDPALVVRSLTVTGIVDSQRNIPVTYRLFQNYPNPFNPVTSIPISISHSSDVLIKIYDTLGQEVETLFSGRLTSGVSTLVWNAKELPSGVYYCRFQADGYVQTIPMQLVR